MITLSSDFQSPTPLPLVDAVALQFSPQILAKIISKSISTIIIAVQHVLPTTVSLFDRYHSVFRLPYEHIFVLGKIYSTVPQALLELNKRHIRVQEQGNQRTFRIASQSFAEAFISDIGLLYQQAIEFLNRYLDRNPQIGMIDIILSDDGGRLIIHAPQLFRDPTYLLKHRIKPTEQTIAGARDLVARTSIENFFQFPPIMVALAETKKIESLFIAIAALKILMQQIPVLQNPKTKVGIIGGNGVIGSGIKDLFEIKKHLVLIHDLKDKKFRIFTDGKLDLRKIIESLLEIILNCEVIIGTTGDDPFKYFQELDKNPEIYRQIQEDMQKEETDFPLLKQLLQLNPDFHFHNAIEIFETLPGRKYFISMSSEDLEFLTPIKIVLHLNKLKGILPSSNPLENIVYEGRQSQIIFFNGGMVGNFDLTPDTDPWQIFQFTRANLFGGTGAAILNDEITVSLLEFHLGKQFNCLQPHERYQAFLLVNWLKGRELIEYLSSMSEEIPVQWKKHIFEELEQMEIKLMRNLGECEINKIQIQIKEIESKLTRGELPENTATLTHLESMNQRKLKIMHDLAEYEEIQAKIKEIESKLTRSELLENETIRAYLENINQRKLKIISDWEKDIVQSYAIVDVETINETLLQPVLYQLESPEIKHIPEVFEAIGATPFSSQSLFIPSPLSNGFREGFRSSAIKVFPLAHKSQDNEIHGSVAVRQASPTTTDSFLTINSSPSDSNGSGSFFSGIYAIDAKSFLFPGQAPRILDSEAFDDASCCSHTSSLSSPLEIPPVYSNPFFST